MGRPNAYADQLCDSISGPLELYLGPGKPPQSITLSFRSGGLHNSVDWSISMAESVTTQKRKRDNANTTPDGKAHKKETSRAQWWATAGFNDVLAMSIKCIEVTEEGPSFLDNGRFFYATGDWVVLLSTREHLGSPTSSTLSSVAKAGPRLLKFFY